MPRIDTTDRKSLVNLVDWFRPSLSVETIGEIRKTLEIMDSGDDKGDQNAIESIDLCSRCGDVVASYGVKVDAEHPSYEDAEMFCNICGARLGWRDD